MKVVSCLILLSERCGGHMKAQLQPVLEYIPQLWNTDLDLFKNKMLALLTQVVKVCFSVFVSSSFYEDVKAIQVSGGKCFAYRT